MTVKRAMEPECVSANVLKRRPHPSLLRVITRKGKHPGRAHRIKRWDRYQVGMSLLHCRETAGLDHLDVLYYARHNLITLRDMTPEERREALRRWDGNNPSRDGEHASSVTREVNAAPHLPARYRARIEVTPEAQIRTPKSNTDWDVNPWTGKKDSKTYEEWRGCNDMATNDELWGASRTARLASARALTSDELNAVHQELCRGCTEPVWPYGSATSINPLMVILGPSPGDSPMPGDADHSKQPPFPLPTAGKPHPRVWYRDKKGKGYWYRVRLLAQTLLDADNAVGDNDALALFGTVNLSTKPSGRARDAQISPPFARWVLKTIRDGLRPRVLVLLGMRGLLEENRELSRLFEDTFDGFNVRKPHSTYRFEEYQRKRFVFREWNSVTVQGSPLLLVDWPQHASQHPFTIIDMWRAASEQFAARHSSYIE